MSYFLVVLRLDNIIYVYIFNLDEDFVCLVGILRDIVIILFKNANQIVITKLDKNNFHA